MTQIVKREMIKTLLQSKQLSPKQIFKNVGISLATVYNVKARLDAGGEISHK